LIVGVQTGKVAADLVKVMSSVYPASHPIYWVNGGQVNPTTLASLTEAIPGRVDLIYLPELADGASLEGFQEIIAHLRAPDGCPWDREQTHLSLRKSLLEETYEALEAMDAQDKAGMVEEFGDIMLQIALHAQIGAEAGEFRMADILGGIYAKIVRRHPHVFGDAQVEGVGGVLQNWEKLKAQERKANGENSSKKGILDGIPAVFPSLAQAQEMQDRAARVGFDWPDRQGVLDKLNEEIEEYRAAANLEEKTSEMGDVLFSLVNLARWEKIDAETALRAANVRFRQRFGGVESSAENSGRAVSDLTLDEMNGFWDEAKRRQRGE
jgi:tetrapyrrole methylase family protein/MazG family protein